MTLILMGRKRVRMSVGGGGGGGGTGTPNFSALPLVSRQVPNASLFASRRALTSGQSFTEPTTGAKIIKLTDSTTDPAAAGVGVANYSEGGPYISQRWGGTNYTLHLGNGEFLEVNGSTNAIIRRASMPTISSTNMGFSMDPATPRMCYYAQGSRIFKYDTQTQTIQNTTNVPTAGREMRYDLDGLVGDEFYIEWFTVTANDDWIAMQANNKRKSASLVNDYFCFFNPKTGAVVTQSDADNNQLQALRDGSAALLATNTQSNSKIFRRATADVQTFSPANGGHPGALTSCWVDCNTVGSLEMNRFNLATLDATQVGSMANVLCMPPLHTSGQYLQASTATTSQYALNDSCGNHTCAPTGGTWTLVSGQTYAKTVDWTPQYTKPTIGITAVLQYTGASGAETFSNTLTLAASAGAVTEGTYFYNSGTETVTLWQVGGGTPKVRLYAAAGNMMGLAFYRADGADARLLVHHGNDLWLGYTGATSTYERYAFGTWSPNGIACVFRSTFGVNSGRADWYLALAPETP